MKKKLILFINFSNEEIKKNQNIVSSYAKTMENLNSSNLEYFTKNYSCKFGKKLNTAYQHNFYCNTNIGEFCTTVFFKFKPTKSDLKNITNLMLNGGSASIYLDQAEDYGFPEVFVITTKLENGNLILENLSM